MLVNAFVSISVSNFTEILSTYSKFLVMRHPLSRLLSAYTDKIGSPNEHSFERIRRYIFKTMRPNASAEEIANGIPTFKEFVSMILTKDWKDSGDTHWGPFDKICQPCSIHYDHILKLESMENDMMPVLDLLASKNKPSEYLASLVAHRSNVSPKANSSGNPERPRRKGRYVIEEMKTLTLDQRREVVKRFEADMKLYGYGFDVETCEASVGV